MYSPPSDTLYLCKWYIRPKINYCCHIWDRTPHSLFPTALNHIRSLIGSEEFFSRVLYSRRRNVASPSFFLLFFFFSCIFVDELHIGSDIYQQIIPCHYQAVELTVRTFIGKICCAISEKWNNRFGNLSATYAVPFPRIRIIESGIYRQHIPCHFHRIRHLSVTYSVPFPGSRIILIFSRFKCKTFPRYKNVFLKKKKIIFL